MTFLRYPHLERFGNDPVADIGYGTCHIFPKLDGTNASVWYKTIHQGETGSSLVLGAGSRNGVKTPENDNAGFAAWVKSQCSYGFEEGNPLEKFFCEYKKYILYGEWLVPHTIKNYREDAWKRFWIFDVFDTETMKMLPYEVYQPMLEKCGLDYIPCIKIINNPSYDNLLREAQNNSGFLLPDGATGEGIVIKNYTWVNKHHQQPWAKIVLNEFKDKFHAAMGASVLDNRSAALIITEKCVTQHLVDKEYAKIVNDNGGEFPKAKIPQLLHTVFYNVVTEELWDQLKTIKYGTVNFGELRALCFNETKKLCPQLF